VTVPDSHWFELMATHMGPAYLRYSFTKGTVQEVGFLVEVLSLKPGMRVLDVGCGPGRHSLELARRGCRVVGLDISQSFLDVGTQQAEAEGLSNVSFVRGDARALTFVEEFDAVISLCQGGFGLVGRTEDGRADGTVLEGMAAALKRGGQLALSAFSAYFQLQHLESTDSFDAATGVNHERTEVRNAEGASLEVDLWTTCFTPLELRLLTERAGLQVKHLYSVTPGTYLANEPTITSPEFLVIASRASGRTA
jgi:SAM-dependent methyltransferase